MAYHPLEKLLNLHDGYRKSFTVAGRSLLLLQQQSEVYLIANVCPHMGAPLSNAQLLENSVIRCKAHGIEFELASGRALGPLAAVMQCLRKYPVAYEGNTVGVDTQHL